MPSWNIPTHCGTSLPELHIPDYASAIQYDTVISRIGNGKTTVERYGGEASPLQRMEPVLCDQILAWEAAGDDAWGCAAVIRLAMDLIQSNAPLEQEMVAYQKRHGRIQESATEVKPLTPGWYRGFLKRNQQILNSKKQKRMPANEKETMNV